MSTVKVNTIDKRTGSTLTLGGSGTAVTLASGATQTGFGRTGTVDWCTTAKTSPFTAVSGDGFFVNTSGGVITVTLPSSPSAGDIVSIKDYAETFQTNKVTIGRNGSKISGEALCATLNTKGDSISLVFVDSTKGWINVQTDDSVVGQSFVTATGGTITTVCTNFKVHTFTSSGCFQVTSAGNAAGSNTIEYMVIAGGAGGGACMGGGGASGGYRESSGVTAGSYTASPLSACVSALSASAATFPITVGAGGAAGSGGKGANGANSVFSSITSAGGGGGGSAGPSSGPTGTNRGAAGGSGGGQRAGFSSGSGPEPGGAGNTPPVSPPQGNPGGKGFDGQVSTTNGGGGGGAGAAGADAVAPQGGNGGAGTTSSINATPTARTGGGGGGSDAASDGSGGAGGGGGASNPGTAGSTNTGSGGGGGSTPGATGGVGGSGIVIMRYKFQ